MGIICACLPMMRRSLSFIFPWLFNGSTRKDSGSHIYVPLELKYTSTICDNRRITAKRRFCNRMCNARSFDRGTRNPYLCDDGDSTKHREPWRQKLEGTRHMIIYPEFRLKIPYPLLEAMRILPITLNSNFSNERQGTKPNFATI